MNTSRIHNNSFLLFMVCKATKHTLFYCRYACLFFLIFITTFFLLFFCCFYLFFIPYKIVIYYRLKLFTSICLLTLWFLSNSKLYKHKITTEYYYSTKALLLLIIHKWNSPKKNQSESFFFTGGAATSLHFVTINYAGLHLIYQLKQRDYHALNSFKLAGGSKVSWIFYYQKNGF